MSQAHSLLRRQLVRHLPAPGDELGPFLAAVDAAYRQSDLDREMLERALDLSSQELLQANEDLRALCQAFPDLFLRVRRDGVVLDVKRSSGSGSPVLAEELVGHRVQDLGLGSLSEGFEEAVARLGDGCDLVRLLCSLAAEGADGADGHFEARLVRSPADQILIIVRNISELHHAEQETRRGLSLLRSTIESTADGILVVALDGRIVLYNERFAQMWRIPADLLATRDNDALLAHVLEQLARPDQFLEKVHELSASSGREDQEVIEFVDGRVFERHSIPQWLDGVVVGRVWSFRDVTTQKRVERQLVHEAIHDSLTGLPNRTLLMDRLEQAAHHSKRDAQTSYAVLFIDLDRFKLVNDSLGHEAGDDLLAQVARRLEGCVRMGDTVARLGGDEFVILLGRVASEADAIAVAERVRLAIGEPFHLRAREIFVSVSVGVAIAAARHDEPQGVLRDADMAMYAAKQRSGGCHQLFDPPMRSTALPRLELESDLRRALERDELLLHYQPIVELATGRVSGFEALLRWRHPRKGLISPLDFIPIAEETGLILPIGRWVLERACREMRAWSRRFPQSTGVSVSVNVSARQVGAHDLMAAVEGALGASSLPARRLVLELTETSLMDPAESSVEVLRSLRAMGVRIHLDDFGTGYSSLGYLHRLPIDALKIDRSFVALLGERNEPAEIVGTMITLARNMGIQVIAEGIEKRRQLERLLALGCDLGQGYHFSPPVVLEIAGALLGREGLRAIGPTRETGTSGGPAAAPQPWRAPVPAEPTGGQEACDDRSFVTAAD